MNGPEFRAAHNAVHEAFMLGATLSAEEMLAAVRQANITVGRTLIEDSPDVANHEIESLLTARDGLLNNMARARRIGASGLSAVE